MLVNTSKYLKHDYIYKCISINYNVVEKLIYFSNSTQIVKLVNSMHTDWSSLSLWFFSLWLFWLTFNKNPPIHSQLIKILHKTFLVNYWPSGKYVHLLYMYSILGRGSFALITAPNSAKPNLLQNVVVLYVVIIMRSFEGLASSLLGSL